MTLPKLVPNQLKILKYVITCYNPGNMLKVKRVFTSPAEADKANREFYQSLSSNQRLDIMLTLITQHRPGKPDEAGSRLKRIYRFIKRT
jgi:hypothetical protein